MHDHPIKKQLLSEFLENKGNQDLIDSSFLSSLEAINFMCPLHHLPFLIEEGYKAIPNRSLSQISETQNSKYPYAICWTRSIKPEKHGAIKKAPVVYCALCNKSKREAENADKKNRQIVFSDNPDEIYRL